MTGHDQMAECFLAEIAAAGAEALVTNAPVTVDGLRLGGRLVPVTVSSPLAGRTLSWVASLRTAYGPYALHELGVVPFAPARPLLAAMVRGLDAAMIAAGLDRLVCVNNWLLSTNLHPRWDIDAVAGSGERLAVVHPGHFIALRSLNARHHGPLLERLRSAGWRLLPARQVWIAEPGGAPNRDRGNDMRLLARTALERVPAERFSGDDWSRVADLYAQLYLGKYSGLNPVFTPRFLAWAHESGFMRTEGLRHADGRLMAVAGTIASDAVMTTPLIGYDLAQPRDIGLYRMATAIAFEDMERRGVSFNLSAGVGGFKRNRGALPAIEYTALWDRHLAAPRRLPPAALRLLLSRLGVPLMERYDL